MSASKFIRGKFKNKIDGLLSLEGNMMVPQAARGLIVNKYWHKTLRHLSFSIWYYNWMWMWTDFLFKLNRSQTVTWLLKFSTVTLLSKMNWLIVCKCGIPEFGFLVKRGFLFATPVWPKIDFLIEGMVWE